jgi:DNA (cytosine-5)-methyltransferase 1
MTTKEKQDFLKKEEMNIRQNLGEAVPTVIFRQIAHKIRKILSQKEYTEQEITTLIKKKS